MTPAAFPRRVSVELTNHCNQRCPLCPRQGFTRPLGFMDVAVFDRLATECAAHDAAMWLHFLGEPLLHPHAIDCIGRAKALGVRQVGLSTNGVTLKGALADALLDAGLDRLECSLDADTRADYAAMRGRDHFERVRDNVRAFLRRKQSLGRERPITSIQFMRTPAVVAALPALVAAWEPYLGPRDFVMTIVPATFSGAIDVGAHGAAARTPCRWLFDAVMVLQDGTVTMCGADWDAQAPLGNVREQSLRAIWNGPELARRRQAHRDGRFATVPLCGTCQDWRLADGSGYQNVRAAADDSSSQPATPNGMHPGGSAE